MRETQLTAGDRYPVLRTIAILWLVGAVIAFAYGIYEAVATLVGATNWTVIHLGPSNIGTRLTACLIWLAVTFFAVIFNVAVAELIKLVIDIEHNTRATAMNTALRSEGAAVTPGAVTGERIGGRLSETAEGELLRGR